MQGPSVSGSNPQPELIGFFQDNLQEEIDRLFDEGKVIKEFNVDLDLTTWAATFKTGNDFSSL